MYVKDSEGRWLLIEQYSPVEDPSVFMRDYLGIYFYSYFVTEVTVSDLNVYKGVALIAAENEAAPPMDIPEDDGNEDENDDGETNKPDNKPPVLVEDNKDTEAAPAPETEAAKGGCGSSIGFCGAAVVMASAIGVVGLTSRRRKDD